MERDVVRCPSGACAQIWSRTWITATFRSSFVSKTYRDKNRRLVLQRQQLFFEEVQTSPGFQLLRAIIELDAFVDDLPKDWVPFLRPAPGFSVRNAVNRAFPYWFRALGQTFRQALARIPEEEGGLDAKSFEAMTQQGIADWSGRFERIFRDAQAAWVARGGVGNFRDGHIAPHFFVQMRRRADPAAALEPFVLPEPAPAGRPCPWPECLGFAVRGKCLVCEQPSCNHCHEVLEDEHACDPGTVATIDAIKKDSKPCPKCRVFIFRPYGCPHMYCVHCHTGFDWNTNAILDTRRGFSNPEWAREQAALRGQVPRAGDVGPCAEDDIPRLNYEAERALSPEFRKTYELHISARAVIHALELRVASTNWDLIAARLLGLIDQKKYEDRTFARDRVARQVFDEISILRGFRLRVAEVYHGGRQAESELVVKIIEETVANFAEVEKEYGCKTLDIAQSREWIWNIRGHAVGLCTGRSKYDMAIHRIMASDFVAPA